jgi:Kef-type K+ transport system membrane component KefB
MKKVYFLSFLLLIGLLMSQILPAYLGFYENISHIIKVGTMICLSFIMIHVGYEFEIEKNKLKQYGKDYLIAFTAATFPWIFVTIYFVFILIPESTPSGEAWVQSLLAARFAAPTSAGVLFSMLAAAGLAATWMFKKTRILAIFDDLDTVILMIPLQMVMIGFKIQLLFILVVMFILVWLAWKYLDKINISIRWKHVLMYSFLIAGMAEVIYFTSGLIDQTVSVHIEVLLPAFVLGTMISKKHNKTMVNNEEEDILELKSEKKVSFILSAIFMVLVGLSMPMIDGFAVDSSVVQKVDSEITDAYVQAEGETQMMETASGDMSWETILFHVFMVTLLSNIGKIMPAFFYRDEASWQERLAVAVAMFPRGEVGAGVLIISMSYGIGGMILTVSMLSLALNLLLTGLFIVIVKRLLKIT